MRSMLDYKSKLTGTHTDVCDPWSIDRDPICQFGHCLLLNWVCYDCTFTRLAGL
jgi:hypothetical protein